MGGTAFRGDDFGPTTQADQPGRMPFEHFEAHHAVVIGAKRHVPTVREPGQKAGVASQCKRQNAAPGAGSAAKGLAAIQQDRTDLTTGRPIAYHVRSKSHFLVKINMRLLVAEGAIPLA
jgi:hypothetical protein